MLSHLSLNFGVWPAAPEHKVRALHTEALSSPYSSAVLTEAASICQSGDHCYRTGYNNCLIQSRQLLQTPNTPKPQAIWQLKVLTAFYSIYTITYT